MATARLGPSASVAEAALAAHCRRQTSLPLPRRSRTSYWLGTHIAVRRYVALVALFVFDAPRVFTRPAQAGVCYVRFGPAQPVRLYIGAAQSLYARNPNMNNTGRTRYTAGWVERESSHLAATFDPTHSDGRRMAYRYFRRSESSRVDLLLAGCGTADRAFLLEAVLLHHFPVLMQARRPRRGRKKKQRKRPWPWQRLRATSYAKDLPWNYHRFMQGFTRRDGSPSSYWATGIHFDRLIRFQRRTQLTQGLGSYVDIWAPSHELLAAAFLAQTGQREIPVHALQSRGFFYLREHLPAVRTTAVTLRGPVRRNRALRNVSRALQRHCGVTPGVCSVRIPRQPDQTSRFLAARQAMTVALAAIRRGVHSSGGPQPHLARYIRSNTKLICTTAPTYADRRINCRKVAREFCVTELKDVTDAEYQDLLAGRDVSFSPFNWEVAASQRPAQMTSLMRRLGSTWADHFGLGSAFAVETWTSLVDMDERRRKAPPILRYDRSTQVPRDAVVFPRDGDVKRCGTRSRKGYITALLALVMADPQHYRIEWGYTHATTAQSLLSLARSLIPDALQPKGQLHWLADALPYFYAFPKTGCYLASSAAVRLCSQMWDPAPRTCSKEHCCERTICARNIGPAWIARATKLAAKAVTVLLRSFRARSARLWDQSAAALELRLRLSTLWSGGPARRYCVHCRAAKELLVLLKMDANSFFIRIEGAEILACLQELMALSRSESGHTGITVYTKGCTKGTWGDIHMIARVVSCFLRSKRCLILFAMESLLS